MADRTVTGTKIGSDLGIRYALELQFGKGEQTTQWMHELTWVENVQVEQPMAVSAKYPIDQKQDAVVQRSKTRRETIVLSGSTGVEERDSPPGDMSASRATPLVPGSSGLAKLDGLGRIKALQKFLAEFSITAADYEGALSRKPNGPKLLLHGLWEGFSYELISADLQRTMSIEQAIGDFQWVLRCVTLKKIDRPIVPSNPMDEDPKTNPIRANDFNSKRFALAESQASINEEVKRIKAASSIGRSWVDDGMSVFDTSRAVIEKGIVALRGVQNSAGRLKTLVSRANLLLQRIEEARDVVGQIGAFPASLFSATVNVVDSAIEEIQNVADEVIGIVPWVYSDLEAAYNDWRGKALGLMAQMRVRFIREIEEPNDDVVGNQAALSQALLISGQTLRLIFVMEGESLMEIAARVLGDVDRWAEIASINGLPDPWTLRDGSPMAAGGATLLVPSTVGATKSYDDDLLGEAFYLDPDTSDLVMRETGFQRVRGFPLVLQSVRERARNVRGSSQAAPEWGLLGIVGRVVNNGDAVRFAIDARSQFLRDSRVISVSNLQLEQIADTIQLGLEIETVGGEGPLVLTTPVATART